MSLRELMIAAKQNRKKLYYFCDKRKEGKHCVIGGTKGVANVQ